MDGPTKAQFQSLEKRISRLEADNKKLKKERDRFKKNLRLFLQRMRAQIDLRW